ncbi:MAG: hypothetical protein ACXVGB_00165 [Mycobacteriaceae bacterium]
MRSFKEWQASLRNFEWLSDSVPGATDLDVFIERRGHFLVIETKHYSIGSGVRVPFGQYLALKALADLPEFDVWLVGETDDPERLYWLDLGSREPTKARTTPVWFKSKQFTRVDKHALGSMAKGWYQDASN